MLSKLTFQDFPPFADVELNFPEVPNKPEDLAEVHLLTGINGTGKTRVLCVLAAMAGEVASLKKRLVGHDKGASIRAALRGSGQVTTFNVSQNDFSPDISGRLSEWLRKLPAFAFNGIAFVTDAKIAVLAGVKKPQREVCLSFSRPEATSGELLQLIANLKVQAAMDSDSGIESAIPSRASTITRSMERAITDITGKPFKFVVTAYPETSLKVLWSGRELFFQQLPDGLRSLIGWMVNALVLMDAWLQGKGNIRETEALFLLDEIESHLHPHWQRRVLPAFQRLFPKAQMFVSTHSPFVVSSLNHGWIHRFDLQDDGSVTVRKPILASAGDSYLSATEDILGVKEWFDPETEKELAEFRGHRLKAMQGDLDSRKLASDLAHKLADRSPELQAIMGRELAQLERFVEGVNEPK